MKILSNSFHCVAVAAAMLVLSPAASPADAKEACSLQIVADLPVTMKGLRASVPVKVNGQDTEFWLDSGAFFSIMPEAKAKELGLTIRSLPPEMRMFGIGGSFAAGVTTIKSFGIVGAELHNIEMVVGGSDAGNALLGHNFLALFDTEFDLAHGVVKLVKPKDCSSTPLAYWAPKDPFFSVQLLGANGGGAKPFQLPVSINGVEIRAELDSGATTSVIFRKAAERAKVRFSGPDVIETEIGGFGGRRKKGWIAPIDKVAVGDEQVLRTHLLVVDDEISTDQTAPDMLLGADFMLAHHIYIAQKQRRIYFTYSGGKAFQTNYSGSVASGDGNKPAPLALPEGTRIATAVGAADPKTASEFSRRGAARLAKNDIDGAIADLTEAIKLAPDTADGYEARADAYRAARKPDLAKADLEKAIALKPGDPELLTHRAILKLGERDKAGALADVEAAARATPPASLDNATLASLLEELGQPRRAIALLDGVIAAHSKDSKLGSLLNARCWSRALANVELDKALADCNGAIKRDGAKAAYLDSRGLVNFRRADYPAALSDYDAALKQEERAAISRYVRGLVKIAMGQEADGKADKAAALEYDKSIAERVRSYGIEPPKPD